MLQYTLFCKTMFSSIHMKQKPFHIILQAILVLSLTITRLTSALDSNTDGDALLAFKSNVFDPQKVLSGWNDSVSHCMWTGISCSNPESRVVSINLPSLRLSGYLPPQLSNLTSLVRLNLFNNSFYGEIPPEYGNLYSIQNFILAANSINGSVPSSLLRCRNLEVIRIDDNHLTGSLPTELGSLSRMKTLNLAINNLTGPIPRSYGNLSALNALILAENQIEGELWDELKGLRNLTSLHLAENHLTGEIPSWLFNISSLEFISLTQNKFVGELPISVSTNLTGLSLRELYLGANRIGGTIPKFLFTSSILERLDMSTNQFQGTVPIPRGMKNLALLHLGYNQLSSTTEINSQLFDALTNSTKLEILYFNANKLTGELPSSVGNLSVHLTDFCVDSNFLSGEFPSRLERYRNLTALSIFNNSFTGNFPNSIGKLAKLQRFQANHNMFYGPIPDIFGNLTQLFWLTLGMNQLTGGIPLSIGNCKQLKTLGFSGNSLSGNIPKEVFGISLIDLRLANNEFAGSIPLEVGNLKQLVSLDISRNRLSGSIPSTIGDCSTLQSLNLAQNNLSGQIPGEIGDILGLESLDLSYNNLSGTIPSELADLKVLSTLNLSFNGLEGQVPRNGVFVNTSWDALQGNYKLCGIDQEISQKLRIGGCLVEKKANNKHHLIAILIPVSIAGVLFFSLLIWMVLARSKSRAKMEACPSPLIKFLPMKISYEAIRRATGGFSPENFLGKGGFGSVYKATFVDASPIENGPPGASAITFAVKVLDLEQSKSSKSFNTECEALKHVRHRNLVKVITSCSSCDQNGAEFKALVMEFMANGNLDKWLYPEEVEVEQGLNLGLMQRISIAIDIASAMDYLHNDCDPPIVHCDLKPGNILLDDDMTARVGDFGLARFLSQNQELEISTIGLKGSIGYIPPEYGLGGRASTSGDAYSFGILLLELFIAKKPTDGIFQDGLNLNKFASVVNDHHRVHEIADPRLFHHDEIRSGGVTEGSSFFSNQESAESSNSSNVDSLDVKMNWLNMCEGCVVELITLGLSCAAQSAKDRVAMRDALAKLHKLKRFLLGSVDHSRDQHVS